MMSTQNIFARCECIYSIIPKSGLNLVIISVPISVATIHAPTETFLNLLSSVKISSLTFDWMY